MAAVAGGPAADRFAGAAQFAEALTRPVAATTEGGARTVPVAAPRGRPRTRLRDAVTMGLATVALAAVGLAVALGRRPAREAPSPVVRFAFSGSDSAPAAVTEGPWPAAISPDGSLLVYHVRHGGSRHLYLRRADQLEGHLIPGTRNAAQPLFSPDGRWLEFEADDAAKKVRFDGAPPAVITRGVTNNGADWTTGNELVVGATATSRGLSRVGVTGGELTPFTTPDTAHGDLEHLWPIGLPDGRAVVFVIWTGALETAELAVASLDGEEVSRLGLKGIRPLAVVDGALVYVRADGAVMAVPLDLDSRRVVGKTVPVLDPVPVVPGLNGNSAVFVSRGGALVSGFKGAETRLTWHGRDGVSRPVGPEVRAFDVPTLSPDGRRIAVVVADGARRDVWINDLETGTLSRLTSKGDVTDASWTGDGSQVVYSAPAGRSTWGVYAQSIGSRADPRMLLEVPSLSPGARLAPDGRSLLLGSFVGTTWDVQQAILDSPPTIRPFHATPGIEFRARISPDGRWASVVSDESGDVQVYVHSYPEPRVKVQVSVAGGNEAAWGADATRLYYATGDAIIEVRLATTPTLRVVSRDTAFRRVPNYVGFDVSRDGRRLLLSALRSSAQGLVVVPGWRAELREKLASAR